ARPDAYRKNQCQADHRDRYRPRPPTVHSRCSDEIARYLVQKGINVENMIGTARSGTSHNRKSGIRRVTFSGRREARKATTVDAIAVVTTHPYQYITGPSPR